ncbi:MULTISPECIES: YpiB family protein [unclassified Enterococcus]|uniref:YpiB family protein n=2 Tax=unclassified Enterococcus TaxID=2608891 RepID=UPI0024738F3E|nr:MULTISPECIES: YpiB family protein [unclassified Enterococcus]MDH6365632.1 uncharacterized protein YpiB (UPF0302 family) [Enterococcus sp. PFB1-1]
MMISVKDKKAFLRWLVKNVSFKHREIVWLLNYLAEHEVILANVHFVELAEATQRGLQIRDSASEGEDLILFLKGRTFTDSDQIFHEIRLNWQSPLYLECIFEDAWQNLLFLSILEDNPAIPWNKRVSEEIHEEVATFLSKDELQQRLAFLYQEIDRSLEEENREEFITLTDEVKEVKEKIANL